MNERVSSVSPEIILFKWLNGHRLWAAALALGYCVLTILPHDALQNPALRIQLVTGMPTWHFGILTLMVLGLTLIGYVFLRKMHVRTNLFDQRLFVAAVAVLLAAGSSLLMANSVEHIHYVQYAILVVLLVPILGDTPSAIALAVLIGMVDEAYQYFVLHSLQPYYDFNDVILNSFGALAGGVIVGLSTARSTETTVNGLKRKKWWLIGIWTGIFVGIAILFSVGILGAFVDTGLVPLNRYPEPDLYGIAERWIDTGWGNHWFKTEPYEGFFIAYLIPIVFHVWFQGPRPSDRSISNAPNTDIRET